MNKNKAAYFLVLILSLPVLAQEVIFRDGFENHDPVIITSPPLTGSVGVPYAYDVDASDIDGDDLLYLLESAPNGMTIDAISGLIGWTPEGSGVYPVTVDVSDGQGGGAFQAWSITVSEGPDSDSDGLGDITEEALGTDPDDPDSDDDGLLDGEEVNTHESDPLDPDTDGDDLTDGDEVDGHGTDPVLLDSDGDDFGDGLELEYGTDPLNPADFPEGPPDPNAMAPPNDPSLNTSLFDATEFLYSGTPPIQTGVAEGAIDAARVAVLRGRVMERDGTPLPGVEVIVRDHPEYGQTTSRVDGRYDLVVNGGGLLTVNVQKSGYLGAQRQADVPWQDYLELLDIALIPLDSKVTAVDLTMGSAQMAAGNPVNDSDGNRQAAVLFPAGTTAELMLDDGSTQPVDNLNVRATEYTVGDNGPQAMPGLLPPASGYTYAVELSVDEAMSEGIFGIHFDQPVYSYTDNFLDFPVGSAVPTGYYDRETSKWIASRNGLVIKIVGISSGFAEIDVDGDDIADSGAALSALGITDAERQSLAASYTPGQELWRVPVEHFTPWDHNWPFGPPLDAVTPRLPSPEVDSGEIEQCLTEASSSIIECQNQAVREEIPVTGTPYLLTYRSTDVPDRKNRMTLKIPLSGDSVPASLKRIELDLSIAGQVHHRVFPATANQSTTFTWDGKDAYQRDVNGTQLLRGTVGYVYDGVYYEPAEREQAFNLFGDQPIEGNVSRKEVTLYQPISAVLGRFDARSLGLGGWRLSVHHAYDPIGKTLSSGAGYSQGGGSITQRTVETVAGVAGDEEGGFNGDDQPATDALIDGPEGVLAMPDGAFLIADSQNHRVRRVGADGVITTIAGTGSDVFSGDGGPAIDAGLDHPRTLSLGPDGSLYVLTWSRLRRITADGIIETIAGSHLTVYGGDGGPAEEATLAYPSGLDVAADGTIFIASGGNRIRRIGTDGIIDTVAGNGEFGPTLDGIPATEAKLNSVDDVLALPDGGMIIAQEYMLLYVGTDGILQIIAENIPLEEAPYDTLRWPSGLALGPDGVYFADNDMGQIGRIDPQGVQTVVAGEWDAGAAYGDGGPPLSAGFYGPEDLSIDSLGRIYIADDGASHIRRIDSAMPGFGEGDIGIASPDGGRYYQFNEQGRHLRTYSTLTGAVLYEFAYTEAGQLESVTDGDGKTTIIQRDGEGNPTGIVSPFGQLTGLSLDVNGFVKILTNPADEKVQIDSSPGGLIEKWTDPRGRISSYEYDSQGLLFRQSDNAGFEQSFVRTPLADGFSVSRTTGMGRTSRYDVQFSPTQVQSNTNTLPDGSQSQAQIQQSSGTSQATGVTGMVSQLIEGADPRFGMQAPIIETLEVVVPGGPTLSVSSTNEATLRDPADPLSLEGLEGTSTIDGRTTSSSFNAVTRTLVHTSPEGRITSTIVDSLGRVISSQYGDLAPVTASYNNLGQLETLSSGSGESARISQFSYGTDGFRNSITDPLGRTVSYIRDSAGRITIKRLPGNFDVSFTYGATGDLDSITTPNQTQHGFTYNPQGLMASIVPPIVAGTGPTTLDYNDDKQILTITRPGAEQLGFEYDAEGRITSVELSENGVTSATYIMSYLVAGQLASITGPGAQTVSYGYQGELVVSESWGGIVEGSINWTYDNAFRLATELVTGGKTINYAYDDDDLLMGAGAFSITRSANNGLVQTASLGVVDDAWAYNTFGEVESYSAKTNAIPVYEVVYSRDDLGRITNKIESIDGDTNTYDYEYDLRGQLIEVQMDSMVVETYTYDDNGNRVSSLVNSVMSSATYDEQDRLLTYGGNTYDYSASGQLASRTEPGEIVTAYDYDIIGNLRSTILPDSTEIAYDLDGTDRRVQRLADGSVTHRFLYDGIQVVAELDENGASVSQFIYAGGNVPVYMIKGGIDYRLVTDQVGSVRLVINGSSGAIVQRIDYDSFGNILNDTNPGFQPFGFAGGIYDHDSGLVLFGSRDYDPESGRWTTKDPIGFNGADTNLYRYANNNPVNHADPDGTDIWDRALGFLNGVTDGFVKLANPALMISSSIEGMADWLLGDWLDENGFYRKPHAGMLSPPPIGVDQSDYLDYHFYGECSVDIASLGIGGAVGAAGAAGRLGPSVMGKIGKLADKLKSLPDLATDLGKVLSRTHDEAIKLGKKLDILDEVPKGYGKESLKQLPARGGKRPVGRYK